VRCLWNALERQDFPVLDFSGRAATVPGGGEDGFRRNKCNSQGRRIKGRRLGVYSRASGI
jgi:hypothetical protein